MIGRAFLVGLLVGAAEVLNGNIRVRYLQRRFGRRRGKQISFATGLCLIAVVAWFFLPWINPESLADCLRIGMVWLVLMTALDLYFGRFVFRFSWRRIGDDFNPLKGNLLAVGLVLLFLCPLLVFLLH